MSVPNECPFYPTAPTWAAGATPEEELRLAERWLADVAKNAQPGRFSGYSAEREANQRLAIARERVRRARIAVEAASAACCLAAGAGKAATRKGISK
jgi:hypothetical protein